MTRKKAGNITSPSGIGEVLGRSFSMLGISTKISEFKIRKHWGAIVGKGISKRTAPGPLKARTLYITVSQSAWMNELQFHKDEIIKKIDSLIGKGAVENIVLKAGHIPEELSVEEPLKRIRKLTEKEEVFIKETVEKIKDQELKKLIRAAMRKRKGEAV